MTSENKLSRLVRRIGQAPLFCQSTLLSLLFGRTIKFAGTAGVIVRQLDLQQACLVLPNRKKVQNHIGSVHAAATALLGESASGFLLGMHVPDDRIPLLKTMHVQYLKRSTGALTAKVSLTAEQIAFIRQQEKGEISMQVEIVDEAGVAPVSAEFIWAWIPKKKPQ